jgi:integrase/recombinase XerD
VTFDDWLRDAGRARTTRRSYVRAVAAVGDLSPAAVAAYFRARAGHSPSALRVTLAALRAHAAFAGVPDPAAGVRVRRPKETLPRPMPMADVERLFARPDVRTPAGLRDRVALELLLHGLRRHEVTQLTTGHLAVAGGTAVLRFRGKGGGEAEVVLNAATAALLAEHVLRARFAPDDLEDLLADHGGRWLAVLEAELRRMPPRPVFATGRGPAGTRWLNRMFARHRDGAGLAPTWGPHSLRHTCATELVDREVDIRVVQEVMRHKDIRMTMRYTQVSRGAKSRAAERLPIPAVRGDR